MGRGGEGGYKAVIKTNGCHLKAAVMFPLWDLRGIV